MKILKYRFLSHVLFWIFIYAFYSFPSILATGKIDSEIFLNLIYIPVDIVTVYLIIGYLIPSFLFRGKFFIFFIGSTLAIAGNVVVSYYLKYNVQPLLGFWVYPRPLTIDIFNSLLSNFMIAGLASALKILRHSFQIQLHQSEVDRRSVQSELSMLRSQVNPHFLFNTLNNIDSLIYEDRDKASNAIFQLSKIMRFMLQESTEEKVLLDKEIDYIKDYLELASLSFPDKNYLEFEIFGNTGDKQVPVLLFIPFIENAVKHCNKQSPPPVISIKLKILDNSIELWTSNSVKINTFRLPGESTGTGLKNAGKRLNLLYGSNYTLNIEASDSKYNVYLKVPLL